jgi:hypothetical protein
MRSPSSKQVAVGRCRSDHDIAALFSLGTEVAIKNIVYADHVLRAATEGQNGRVGLCRIVAIWKDDLVMNGRAGHRFHLFEHFRPNGLGQEHHNDRDRWSEQHPLHVLSLHIVSFPAMTV